MNILSLIKLSLYIANQAILDQVNFQIHAGERIALLGRNGAGKSSLLKLILGELSQDAGDIHRQAGLQTAGLSQDVPVDHQKETVFEFLNQAYLSHPHAESMDTWDAPQKIKTLSEPLGLPLDQPLYQLSGGLKRKALLAAALLQSPDLLLLDEPTNHLDLPTIEWLESYLKQFAGTVLFVTHDREFLNHMATRIVEIDRGQLYSYDCNYEKYLDRREGVRLAEEKQNALTDKRRAEEEVWLRQGIKARRTRNEGRVRRLEAMREAYRERRAQVGQVKSMLLDVNTAGKMILEAEHLSYHLNHTPLIHDFSFLLTRGDKVGIIGPNGSGKTTLIRLLLGELKSTQGTLKHGTSLQIAYFDQLRRELDESKTVMQNVADGADYVMINDQKKHVASYLSDFLFTKERFNQPVFSLSGGERNRLLLAKLFAKPVNLLIMDEPTNDLDIETLELLESILIQYTGTLLIISHDRAFINNVVSSVLVFEENGHIEECVGGYDDYLRFKTAKQPAINVPKPQITTKTSSEKNDFAERKELKQLLTRIETLEKKLSLMNQKMASPEFYQQTQDTIITLTTKHAEETATLQNLYERWEALEEKINR